MPTPTWPAAGQQVTLLGWGEQERLAVVDDVRPPHCLVLREPVSCGASTAVGKSLALHWTTAAGRHELTARLVREIWDRMPLWELEVLQDPSVSQQRAFARAPDALPVELAQRDRRWHGVAVDISEGGARCSLVHADQLRAGDTVELRLSLETRQLALRADVLSVETAPNDRSVARLRFTAEGWTADALRRRVMEQQRRARAAARA